MKQVKSVLTNLMDITSMRSIIIGAGTYGEVYLAYLQESGAEIIGFLDDNKSLQGRLIRNIPVLGGTELLPSLRKTYQVEAVYCPIGNNKQRVSFLEEARALGYKTPNYIHPSVIMASNICISNLGVYILAGTSIMPYVKIDDFVMISVGARISHHSTLEKGTFVSTGVNLGASLVAKRYAYMGIGSTIMTGVRELGTNCLIGAGAVVIKDVPDNAVMAGVPARILRIKES